MKRSLLSMIATALMLIPVFSFSQPATPRVVEQPPDPSEILRRFSETPYAANLSGRSTDPAIVSMVAAINADSLRKTLQDLQNLGSRFLMNTNKKEIATSLLNRFLAYGYTDVALDSFYLVVNFAGMSDSSWQYNVVCTVTGSSAPGEIYVVGGHYDSYCTPNPFTNAPGVDDNGTAVAATLEIARVMKQFNYRPEATIRFTLFGAEELGLFGSRDAAAKARTSNTDIRYMLNLDMLSNNPENLAQVKIFQYIGQEWAGLVAAEATERYTDLAAVFSPNLVNSGSDSFPYWLEGFPSVYFEEIVFSPNWHRLSDTLGNCNVPYLKKVTGAVLATLAEQQSLPYPQNLRAHSSKEKITLRWKAEKNAFVKGFNVYRSETSGTGFQKITSSPVADSMFNDVPAALNKQFYYLITTVNDSLQESAYSNEVLGARFNFCDSLLVLANLKGEKVTPDSILAFYQAVLDTIPYRWMDINAVSKANLAQFSRYRSILWMSNSLEYEPLTNEMYEGVQAFAENGGNMLFAGFGPGRFWLGSSIPFPLFIPEEVGFHQLFKVDTIDYKMQCMMFRANAAAPGYDTMYVDSTKYLDKNFPGQIFNVEVYAPSPEGNVIYRLDSRYSTTTSFGKMKNRPVGIEYMGTDHKSILLSFPLYYMDTSDAHAFLNYVMTKKFANPVGVSQPAAAEPFALHVFPNPVSEACNIAFTLDEPGRVKLSLLSMMGTTAASLIERRLERGTHMFRFSTATLVPGLYQVLLQQGDQAVVKKMIRVE